VAKVIKEAFKRNLGTIMAMDKMDKAVTTMVDTKKSLGITMVVVKVIKEGIKRNLGITTVVVMAVIKNLNTVITKTTKVISKRNHGKINKPILPIMLTF
jgi:hypothetical protein